MSIRGLHEVVGKAAISDSFRAGLFNGQRAEMLRQFADKLDAEEQQALLNIQAEVLYEFAAAIELLIAQREGRRPTPPAERVTVSVAGWANLIGKSAFIHHA